MKTKNLLFICYFITISTLILSSAGVFSTLNLYLETRDNPPLHFGWLLTAKILETFGFFFLFITFLLISKNIAKGNVFVKRNEKILSIFGLIVIYIGLINSFIMGNITTISQWTNPNSLFLIGFVILFFAVVFKIGIKMKEEQDLTI